MASIENQPVLDSLIYSIYWKPTSIE